MTEPALTLLEWVRLVDPDGPQRCLEVLQEIQARRGEIVIPYDVRKSAFAVYAMREVPEEAPALIAEYAAWMEWARTRSAFDDTPYPPMSKRFYEVSEAQKEEWLRETFPRYAELQRKKEAG